MTEQYQTVIDLVHQTKSIVIDPAKLGDVRMKGASDFVTAVDLGVSAFLHTELARRYPKIGFMSEEEDSKDLNQNRWILDPVDGTTNLIFDYRLSSVSLALMKDGAIAFGVVYNPFTEETFSAEKGKGAFLNGKQIFVSDREISESLIEFGAGSTRKSDAEESFRIAKEIFSDCVDIRRICSTALVISYIAAKRIDGYFEKVLKPWDYAAASLILQEAGGVITDWSGNPVQFDQATSIIASNKKNHEYLLSKMPR